MIRVSEAVLPGHPDKLCDFVAESIVQAALAVDPEAYAQIEAGDLVRPAVAVGRVCGARARRSTSSGSRSRRSSRSRGP